jgi:hypothetical protein
MFIGRGFDTDGDGKNDVFIGQKLSDKQSSAIGCGAMIGLATAAIAIPIAIAANNDNMGFLQWISNNFAWGVVGSLVGFGVLVSVLSAFLQPPTALLITLGLFGVWFGLGYFGLGMAERVLAMVLGAVALFVVVLIAAAAGEKSK